MKTIISLSDTITREDVVQHLTSTLKQVFALPTKRLQPYVESIADAIMAGRTEITFGEYQKLLHSNALSEFPLEELLK